MPLDRQVCLSCFALLPENHLSFLSYEEDLLKISVSTVTAKENESVKSKDKMKTLFGASPDNVGLLPAA